jgi:hypothetical protein
MRGGGTPEGGSMKFCTFVESLDVIKNATLPCATALASDRTHGDRYKPFKDKRVILAADNRQRHVSGTRSWTLGQLGLFSYNTVKA